MKKVDLTPKEIKLIKLICKQLTAKEIADETGYSFRTVEDYCSDIKRKIGAKNLIGIALYAVKHEIVKVRR
jgi:DNA-binding NarL/FixJ family response regulator